MDHCFVICVQNSGQSSYLADGTNLYKCSSIHRDAISPILGGLQIQVLDFNYQINEDHCATSGACIVLDFCKRHRTKIWSGQVIVKSTLYNQIASVFHKHPWVKLGARKLMEEQNQQDFPEKHDYTAREPAPIGIHNPAAVNKKSLIWARCDLCNSFTCLVDDQRRMSMHRLRCMGANTSL